MTTLLREMMVPARHHPILVLHGPHGNQLVADLRPFPPTPWARRPGSGSSVSIAQAWVWVGAASWVAVFCLMLVALVQAVTRRQASGV
jgi:hypothetical protein